MSKIYGGRWEKLETLDQGGQAQIFLVSDKFNPGNPKVVLKRLMNPKRHERFVAEVQAIKQLSHPNIIQLLDHSALDGNPDDEKAYLVMPHMKGGNLATRVALYKESLDSTIIVASQIASALKTSHRNQPRIIHRDAKPENILFCDPNSNSCVLSDFGICLIDGRERQTHVAERVGPIDFMAPELEGGGKLDVSPGADIYSLGKVIYFMYSGGVILPRERMRDKGYDIFSGRDIRTQRLGRLLDQMICDVQHRLSSVEEVEAALEEIKNSNFKNTTGYFTANAMNSLKNFSEKQTKKIEQDRLEEKAIADRKAAVESYSKNVEIWMADALQSIASTFGTLPDFTAAVDKVLINGRNFVELGHHHKRFEPLLCFRLTLNSTHKAAIARFQYLFFVAQAREIYFHHRLDSDAEVAFFPLYYPEQGRGSFLTQMSSLTKGQRNWVSNEFKAGGRTIVHLSKISSWPSDIEKYEEALKNAIENIADFVKNDGGVIRMQIRF